MSTSGEEDPFNYIPADDPFYLAYQDFAVHAAQSDCADVRTDPQAFMPQQAETHLSNPFLAVMNPVTWRGVIDIVRKHRRGPNTTA